MQVKMLDNLSMITPHLLSNEWITEFNILRDFIVS